MPTDTVTTSALVNERASRRAEPRLLIDGALREASTGARFDNTSPATGKVLGSTAAASADDMDDAIAAARTAFDVTNWRTDRSLRKRCLLQLQEALESEQEDLRDELIAEVGAPVMTTNIAGLKWPLADALRFPAELIESFDWERELGAGSAVGGNNRRRVIKEPTGVVGVIAPWNFPFEIVLNKLGQVLATGNTVVVKPDPNTPWSATRIGRLISENTDIPPGVVNVVPTPDNAIAERLILDPRVDMISFTGSTDTGRLIAAKGAPTLKRVFLELGGKSAMVILDDADLDTVLPNAAQVCLHSGQGCAITTRVLVPHNKFDDFMNKVTGLFGMIAPGDPARPETVSGPVINRRQLDRIAGFVQRAVDAGAEVTVGGHVAEMADPELAGGNYYQPTVIAGVDNSAEIARREVFGPVLVVLPYRDDAEALAIANDSEYGLSGSVFSSSLERGMAFAQQLRTGTVNVNKGVFYGADSPFGGYKQSGLGRQNGIEGFEQHLQTKVIGYQ